MGFEMNTIRACLFLVGGLLILWKTADLLVTGAVSLARRLGVSPLVIGLTVLAMGTSAPELAAGIAAVVKGAGDAAIGNVYGSNIANLALVGGLCAIIRPITVSRRVVSREMPVMVLVGLLLWPFLHNLFLSRPEGIALLAIFAALILITVYAARRDAANNKRDTICDMLTMKKCVFFVVIGLAGLALGADITVRGAVFIGTRIGLSQAVIGMTIIAFGTSLPELVTCLAAAVKGQDDISIGNIVGSNIFNTLLVTGTAGVVRPFALAGRLGGLDWGIMIAVSVGFGFVALVARRISRLSGIVLFSVYIVYIVYLFTCP